MLKAPSCLLLLFLISNPMLVVFQKFLVRCGHTLVATDQTVDLFRS